MRVSKKRFGVVGMLSITLTCPVRSFNLPRFGRSEWRKLHPGALGHDYFFPYANENNTQQKGSVKNEDSGLTCIQGQDWSEFYSNARNARNANFRSVFIIFNVSRRRSLIVYSLGAYIEFNQDGFCICRMRRV